MKYRIELGDAALNFRASAVHDFHREVFFAESADFRFFVDGKQVTKEQALEACQAAFDAAFEKKSQTHKRVRVCKGVTTLPSNYRNIWVRK